jgi:hypothetical protein
MMDRTHRPLPPPATTSTRAPTMGAKVCSQVLPAAHHCPPHPLPRLSGGARRVGFYSQHHHSLQHIEEKLIDQHDDLTTAASPLQPSPPPTSPQPQSKASDFKKVRKHLHTAYHRAMLGRFIAAGWTPAELAEYACTAYLGAGKKRPTSASYRFVLERGADHVLAQEALATMRAPGYVRPTFEQPEPKDYAWDDPDNPAYSDEVRSATRTLARSCMNSCDDRRGRPRRGPDHPIRKALLRSCFRELYSNNAFGLRTDAR